MQAPTRLFHRISLCLLLLVTIWGLLMVLFPVRPFWIDEWRLIYNLKFKTGPELWGQLAYTQQAPRLYLTLLKEFSAALHYSYFSLRLPAFILSACSILLLWRIMQRVFTDRNDFLRPLSVLILGCSETFLFYIVQTKHYEAEVFCAVLAIWQLLEFIRLADEGTNRKYMRYALFCFSMASAPLFSYTYPIAITPVLLISGVSMLHLMRAGEMRRAFMIVLPLVLSVAGIAVFYVTDISQLMQDKEMHQYWAYRMASNGPLEIVLQLWYFFATVGSGALFEIIFGVLGVVAFIHSMRFIPSFLKGKIEDKSKWVQVYGALLVLLVAGLFFAGKLPLGEAKFSIFCVPVMGMLITLFLKWLYNRYNRVTAIIGGVLYAGLAGCFAVTAFNSFFAPEYDRRMAIYNATEHAIAQAQTLNVPIFVTPGVAWPDEIVHVVPHLTNMPADAILKTFPAYSVKQQIPVYVITDSTDTRTLLSGLPDSVNKIIAGDGLHYRVIQR